MHNEQQAIKFSAHLGNPSTKAQALAAGGCPWARCVRGVQVDHRTCKRHADPRCFGRPTPHNLSGPRPPPPLWKYPPPPRVPGGGGGGGGGKGPGDVPRGSGAPKLRLRRRRAPPGGRQGVIRAYLEDPPLEPCTLFSGPPPARSNLYAISVWSAGIGLLSGSGAWGSSGRR